MEPAMSMTIRQLASRIYDRLFRGLRGFGRPVPASVWDKDFADGKWAHLSDIAETTRYAIVHNYIVRCKSPASVLDIGCGTGVLRERFSEAEVARYTGIDVSQEAVRTTLAKGFTRSSFVVANFDEYQPEGGYDAIVFNESIGYASDPGETFDRYWKLLSAGGICVVSLYDFDARTRAGWKRIERMSQPRYSTRQINEKGQAWDIKVFVKG
jgi:trans-aconitate methyltransferase